MDTGAEGVETIYGLSTPEYTHTETAETDTISNSCNYDGAEAGESGASAFEKTKHSNAFIKKGGAVTAGIIMSVPSVFGAGEAKASNEPEPIPADVYTSPECVEHPYEDKKHVAVGGTLKNLSSSTVEAQHRIPAEETILDYSDMWAEFAPGQFTSTPSIILETSSIPETEVIFYAKRTGEPEQIVGSKMIGPKNCMEGGDEDENTENGDDNTEEEPGVGGGVIDTSNACPPEKVPDHTYTDVEETNVHDDMVSCVTWYEVAHGITEHTYAPAGQVTRGQMGSFIARSMDATDIEMPEPSDQGFTDTGGSVHEDRINQLAELGVVRGIDAETYAPRLPVTRAQMASFLVRAFNKVTGRELGATSDHFNDDNGNTHEAKINAAAEAGLTVGTTPETYEPHQPVRRDQMASFLSRLLELMHREGHVTKPDESSS